MRLFLIKKIVLITVLVWDWCPLCIDRYTGEIINEINQDIYVTDDN